MKKNLFLLGLAVAAMTSCTNDEVLEQAQPVRKAIGFESFVNKTTRAVVETTNDGLSKFFVNGYYMLDGDPVEVFTKEAVTKAGSKWDYAANNYKYWTDNPYYFAGYAQSNSDNTALSVNFEPGTGANSDKQMFSIMGHTMNYTADQTTKKIDYSGTDIVADLQSVVGSTSQNPGPVSFNFRHLFSKVKFTVYNTDPIFTMNITDLTINNVKYKGDFISSYYNDWAPLQTDWVPTNDTYENFIPVVAEDRMAPWTDSDIANAASQGSNELLVMPQDLSSVTFSITAEFYSGSDLVYTLTFDDESIIVDDYDVWMPNTYYNYTIMLPSAASRIEFGAPTVAGWGNAIPIELNSGDNGANGARQ